MEKQVLGLHHITAIASNPRRNLDFYTQILGMRLVKRTVNFDDPGTYHFYYGDKIGSPGTILTFFPWEGAIAGKLGTGMATDIGYVIPPGSLDFWKKRLETFDVDVREENIFGERWLSFRDPDGLRLQFVEKDTGNHDRIWTNNEISTDQAIRGFYNVTLLVQQAGPTRQVLTDILGYQVDQREGARTRLKTEAIHSANIVDLVEYPAGRRGLNAVGTNHHIAFRVKDEATLMAYREKVLDAGLHITPKIDRDYFYSVYFREPGGTLFELATDNPGFMRDETVDHLGTDLKLPKQYEANRAEIEAVLPDLR